MVQSGVSELDGTKNIEFPKEILKRVHGHDQSSKSNSKMDAVGHTRPGDALGASGGNDSSGSPTVVVYEEPKRLKTTHETTQIHSESMPTLNNITYC